MRTCSVPYCTNKHKANGLCGKHLQRLERTGRLERQTLEERFMKYVHKEEACWLWTGYVNTSGYGSLTVKGTPVGAHRLSFMLFKGEVPDGKVVCHTCDVRTCVNPEHLWLGSNRENLDDMLAKGRQSRVPGEQNGMSKLTEDQVRAIRQEHIDGATKASLCRKYEVSSSTMDRLIKRQSWAHI